MSHVGPKGWGDIMALDSEVDDTARYSRGACHPQRSVLKQKNFEVEERDTYTGHTQTSGVECASE